MDRPDPPAGTGSLWSRPHSIRGKVVVSLFLMAAVGLTATVAAQTGLTRIADKIRVIESFYELNQKILETRRHEKNFLLYGTASDLLDALEYLRKVQAAIAQVRRLAPPSAARIIPDEAELATYSRLLQALGDPRQTAEVRGRVKEEIRRRGQILTNKVLEMDTLAREHAEAEARRYQNLSFAIIFVYLLTSIAVAALLIRWIVGPLAAIRRAAARVMAGELALIPLDQTIGRSVEGLELAKSLNRMLDALAAKQAQLLQSAKMAVVGQVTAGIAHEINNPLNNIVLTAEVLLEDLPNLDCAERLEMVNDVLVQADRAREVVRRLLDFSRSRRETGWEEVDLARLARAGVDLLKNQMRLDQITAAIHLPAEPVLVLANLYQLQQVLVNILLNGMQAAGQGGHISVTVSRDDEAGRALVTVTDSGPGIPPQIRAQIFDPFFTTKAGGTGLGLPVSHAIIREHHGEIRVTSEPGEGATFAVVLPLLKREDGRP
ncbi:MAG: ATP-binding protein [Thermodesulfobacteriota bacterium]